MSTISRKLAETALEIKAIKLSPQNPFTWTSGYRMPIYNDNRLLLGRYEHRSLVADGFVELIERHSLKFEVVAGTATAGMPFGTTLADRLKLPFVYVREKPKAHGTGKRVEGVLNPGTPVLLIEDLISMGTSSTSACEGLRNEGGTVAACLSIFNYELQEARDAFTRVSVPIHSLLGFSELLQVAKEKQYISASDYDMLASWSKEPTAWGEKHGFPKVVK
jgi:orotate phosphoribosyltransferase